MSLTAGTRLGPYVLESLIGAGGMGEVYRAHDSRLNRTVAIKVLAPEIATPDRVERFTQEARAASALNHPNILTIHDVGREADTAYFAMEWVDGQTLRQLLRGGPIPIRRSLQLAHQIAEGLAKAHAAGIVHRDLKPENVMVTGDGLAKIVDFGLAKVSAIPSAGHDNPTVTRVAGTEPGIVMGTAGYMSPEQASGRAVDYRSDQFALGLLIYELVTRTRPFERATTAQSLAATIEAEPTAIEALNAEVPPHLATIVARCLAKDPAERYESTRDLARDLKSIIDSSSRSVVTTPAAPRSPRRRYLAAIAAVVLIAGVGTVAWLWRAAGTSTRPANQERPLVAVRPFRSLSADPQQGYFAAGMTDEIRGQLSQVSSLRLLSRNALDAYKDGDSSRMVRELGVRNLVDGSVRVDGNRVRIAAELVDASTNETLWSDQYDRELADILAVQSDVAVQITRALHANLSPHEQQRLEVRPTENLEAYRLYLQSQQIGPLTDRARNLEGMDVLRKALALDPRFATAQARLGYRLVFMAYYDDPSYIDQGLAETQAALRVDPNLPYAYFTLGTAYTMKGMDAQARQAFLRALELDPNNVLAMDNLSIHEATFGRLDESLYWGRRGFSLSGKTGNDYYHVAVPLLSLRDDDGSRTLLLDGERRFPEMARIHIMLGLLDIYQGRAEQAVARTEAMVARAPQNEEVKFHRADIAFLTKSSDLEMALEPLMERSASNFINVYESVRLRYAYALQKRGEAARAATLLAEAERIAREKVEKGDQTPALRIELAAASELRGDHAGALEWLSRAYDAGCRDYGLLERDPILAPLGSDARLRGILERMRKDVDAQRARARERGLLDIDALLVPRDR
jgi:serine/threonine protein kinase/tetratricopeptide (TPR) repeat protein